MGRERGYQEGDGGSRGKSTGGGCPLLWPTNSRLLAGSLTPTWETALWCLAIWPLGNSGGRGNPPYPQIIPCHISSLCMARGSLRAGTLLLLSVPSAGHGTNDH